MLIKNYSILACFLALNLILCGDNGVNNDKTLSVADAWWTDQIDCDGDGYTQFRRLIFNMVVSPDTHSVYVEIHQKLASTSTYSFYYKSEDFKITGISDSVFILIGVGGTNGELSNNTYDFELRVYRSGSSLASVKYGTHFDRDLNDQFFETVSQDTVKAGDL